MSHIFTLSRDTLSVFLDGVPKTIDKTHSKFDEILDIATGKTPGTAEDLKKLIDFKITIQEAVSNTSTPLGSITVGSDHILLNGKPIHNHLTKRMMDLLKGGFDITPWVRFMEKLYTNPSKTAVDELFLWLEQSNLPIVENGNFLAYKKVRDDYGSYYDGGKTKNTIGTVVWMGRNEVDDNRERTCSQGLHFCSWKYLPSYYGNQGKVLVLEINPAEVVSIPSDYNNAKGRAWRYLIRGEINEQDAKFAFLEPLVEVSEWNDEWGDEFEDDFDDTYNSDLGVNVDPETGEFDWTQWDNSIGDFEPVGKPHPLGNGTYTLKYSSEFNDTEVEVTLDAEMKIIRAVAYE